MFSIVTQNTCSHDAKVMMAGHGNMYECTRCHKFIPAHISKDKESRSNDITAPEYVENGWEDDD